jgi:DNA-binding LytR/AlgR family response regulator
MNSRKCLLIEDSKEAIIALEQSLSEIGLYCLKQVGTTQEAEAALRQESFDLLFVDIRLGAFSGLDFLKSYTNLPPAIIISSCPEYAIDAYDIEGVADFVSKPYSSVRLRRAINRAIGTIYHENAIVEKDFAFLKSGRSIVKFAYKDIDYIKAYGVYSKVYKDESYALVNEPISTLLTSLPGNYFRRVHKSYIVNLRKITSYDSNYFYMGDHKIPIGVTYRDSLKALFRILSDESV